MLFLIMAMRMRRKLLIKKIFRNSVRKKGIVFNKENLKVIDPK